MKKESEKIDDINALIGMIESCYTYGGIEVDSWNFERYISPYIDKLGKQLFNRIYKQESTRLKAYKVIKNVYTDNEGLTYNSLTFN